MSGPQIASGGTGTTINIGQAENVYVAENIYETNIHVYNGCDTSSPKEEHDKVVAECGDGEVRGNHVSRWTQTNVSSRIKNSTICNNYMRVDVHIAAQVSPEGKLNVQGIGDAVSAEMARLHWVGLDDYKSLFTAWKMKTTEEMTKLQDEVIKCIRSETDRYKLQKAVQVAFEKSMKLMAMDSGSLVFIFQHKTKQNMDHALTSSEFQQTIQQSLLDFLPSWVKRETITWTVEQCNASVQDESSLCQLSEPIPLFISPSTNLSPLDLNLIQRMIAKTLTNHMDSFKLSQQQTLEQLGQKHTSILREMLTQFSLTSEKPTLHRGVSLQTDCPGAEAALHEEGTVDGLDKIKRMGQLRSPGNKETRDFIDVSFDTDKRAQLNAVTSPSVKDQNVLSKQVAQPFPGSTFLATHSAIAAPVFGQLLTPYKSEPLDTRLQKENSDPPTTRYLQVPSTKRLTRDGDRQYVDQKPSAHHHRDDVQLPIQYQLGDKYATRQGVLSVDHDTKEVNQHSKELVYVPLDRKPDRETGGAGARHSHRVDDSSTSEEHKAKTKRTPQKSKTSKKEQADQLLSWVNVKSRASTSRDPEIERMVEQVEDALQDEEKESPKARALDTVIVMDTSDSVVKDHLDELKTIAHTFIDGIEENVDTMNLEENLAVIQMGDRAWVRQHLTNDYTRVRDAIDSMTPDSKRMPTGGRTAMFQALMVCLGALEGKGGVVSVAGCHRVRPRLIFFTDGRPTDESTEKGLDIQSSVNEVKFALVQLISEFASKKHKTTPAPIFWVPVGDNPDRAFMESLAALSWGKVVEKDNVEELCTYYKIQETIGCVYKMVRKHKELYDEQQTKSVINALAGNLSEDDKNYVLEEVRKKQKDPENESADADDFDNVYEDTELVTAGHMLPLGSRVKRGKDWKWGTQDTEGPGTVIQHRKKRDGWLHVLWDNGAHNAYRYGDGESYDVEKTDKHPRILGVKELIEIGVEVRRGEDWKSGDEDGNGPGIVIRKRRDAKVKVRWANGYIGKYKFGTDGKMELKVVADCIPREPAGQTSQAPGSQDPSDSELGATGGHDTSEGEKRLIWQWYDTSLDDWRTYTEEIQDKLLNAYKQRADGSGVINKDGETRRVMFKNRQEKAVDKGSAIKDVRMERVTESEYRDLLKREEER